MKRKKTSVSPKSEKRLLFELLIDLFLSLPKDTLVSICKFEKRFTLLLDAISDLFMNSMTSIEEDEEKQMHFYRVLVKLKYLSIILAFLFPLITNRKIIITRVSLPLIGFAILLWLVSLYIKYVKKAKHIKQVD